MAIVHTKDPEEIRREMSKRSEEWHGIYSDRITMSVGYASHNDKPGASIDDLEHIADADMYAEKDRYYSENGLKRR